MKSFKKTLIAAKRLAKTNSELELVTFFLGLILTILIGNYGAQHAIEFISKYTNEYIVGLKSQKLLDDDGYPVDPE